jgi:acetyltransferase-like isoleucine patch superfamily enzyme
MITRFKFYIKNILLNCVASNVIIPPNIRQLIYEIYGFRFGKGAAVFPLCFCGTSAKLVIGKGSFINYRCFLDLSDDIIIGDNVSIGFECKFITSFHELGNQSKRASKGKKQGIVIGDGCWIGANCTIMPGVTIASGCVVGANSLVTRDTECNSLYVGCPAIKVKNLP